MPHEGGSTGWISDQIDQYGYDFIKIVQEDAGKLGIPVKIRFLAVSRIQLIFKNKHDMNLYKMLGNFNQSVMYRIKVEYNYGLIAWMTAPTTLDSVL